MDKVYIDSLCTEIKLKFVGLSLPSRRQKVSSVLGLCQLQRGPTLRYLSAMEVHMKHFHMYEKG